MAKKMRKIDVGKKVSGLELSLTKSEDRPQLEFDFYEKSFTTLNKIPALVMQKSSVLSDEDSTAGEQLDALIYSLRMILVKEDRKRFMKVLEDEGVEFEELFVMYANLIEGISASPLEESSSPQTGSKKKQAGKSSLGTLQDLEAAES